MSKAVCIALEKNKNDVEPFRDRELERPKKS